MASNLDKYISLFYKLLPSGRAWTRRHTSNLYKLISSYMPEMARIEEDARLLLRESNPARALTTLEDWEKALGLPDHCTANLNLNIEQRRKVVLQKLIAGGGSSIQYYELIASIFGYEDIKATDYQPFRMGKSQMGDQLSGEGWEYTFKIFSPNVIANYFQMGKSQMGDQLRTFGDPAMECIIKRVKHAHLKVLFSYGTGE